jgi:hypothetical protein
LGNCYAVGQTGSAGWIWGGYDTTFNYGVFDAFVVKIGETPRTLNVLSTPRTGFPITGTAPGETNYSSVVLDYNLVTLKAVSSAAGGYAFIRWNRDGTNQTPGKNSLSFTITHDTTVTARYGLYRYLLITGPSRVYERSYGRYHCYLYCRDGSRYDVTNYATWADSSSYVRFSKPGYLKTSAVSADKRIRITVKYAKWTRSIYVTIRNR